MSMSSKQRDLLKVMRDASRTIQDGRAAALVAIRDELGYSVHVDQQRLVPPSEKDAAKREKRESTASKLSDIRLDVERAQRDYDEAFDLLSNAPTEYGSFGADDRREAWDRLRSRLDALPEKEVKVVKAKELLERAEKVDDRATLHAAYMNLGSYLESHGEELPESSRIWLAVHGGPEAAQDAILVDMNESRENYRAKMAVEGLEYGHRNYDLPVVVPGRGEGTVIAVDPRSSIDPKELPPGVKVTSGPSAGADLPPSLIP